MNMSINTYSQAANQLMQRNDLVIVQGEQDNLRAERPVSPPGNWTKFKAALASLPVLGALGSLREARAEVDSYPIRFADQQASSRRFLNGLAQELRTSYGNDIADLAMRDIDRTGGTLLSARALSTVLDNADRSQKNHQAMNNMAVTRFLESPLLGPSKMPGDNDMNGIFLDRNMQLNGTNSWQEALGKQATDFITKYVQKQCSEQPVHSQGHLSNAQITDAATKAFDLYQEIKSRPGIDSEKLSVILQGATSMDSATDIRDEARGKANETINDMAVTRFLESPGKMPGDSDMNGIFLSRNMQLNGANGWQEALGKPAADFLTKYIQKQCSELPAHRQGNLSNAQFAEAANKALDLYEEIKAQPGVNSEKLAGFLQSATVHNSATSICDEARGRAIMDKVDPMLNRRNPESLLSRTAVEVARQYKLPAIPDAVLKCISNNMFETLNAMTPNLATDFSCAPDPGSVLAILTPKLEANVRTALEEHCKALHMIDASITLNPAQQTMLHELAAGRRLDPTQIAQYERVGALVAQAASDIAENLATGNFGSVIASLRSVLNEGFSVGLDEMQKNGKSFWEDGSIKGGDMTYTMMDQFLSVAFAGMEPGDAKALLDQLAGSAGHQVIQGLMHSSKMELGSQLTLAFSFLTGAVAKQSGLVEKEAEQLVNKLNNEVLDFNTLPEQLQFEVNRYE